MDIKIINQNEAFEYVKNAIKEEASPRNQDPEQWGFDTEFNSDMDLTSLDIAFILENLEKKLNLDLDINLSDLITIKDMCHLIQKRATFVTIKTLLATEVLNEADVEHLKPYTNMQTDLGMDSIEIYDLYALIEQHFNIVLPPRTKEITIGKLCDLIIHCQNSKAPLNNIWKHIAVKKHRKQTRKYKQREQILPKIKEVMMQEGFITQQTKIDLDTNLIKDLKLDYLDRLSFNYNLNKSFDISLPDNMEHETMGNVCDNVLKHLKIEAISKNIAKDIVQMLSDVIAREDITPEDIQPNTNLRKVFSKRDILTEQDLLSKRVAAKYHVDITDTLSTITTAKDLCFVIAEKIYATHSAKKSAKKAPAEPTNARKNASLKMLQELTPVLVQRNFVTEPVNLLSEIEIRTIVDRLLLAKVIKAKYNVDILVHENPQTKIVTVQDLINQIIQVRIAQFNRAKQMQQQNAIKQKMLAR